jgi:hypothetical protein
MIGTSSKITSISNNRWAAKLKSSSS